MTYSTNPQASSPTSELRIVIRKGILPLIILTLFMLLPLLIMVCLCPISSLGFVSISKTMREAMAGARQ